MKDLADHLHHLVVFGTSKDWRSIFVQKLHPEIWKQCYRAYIVSACWIAKRTACLERNGRCKCGSKAVQAHHLTYERLGDEKDSDLESVCVRCHKEHHGKA